MALDPRIPLMAQGMNLEPRANALMRGLQTVGVRDQNALRQMQMQQMQQAAQQAMMEREAQAKRQQEIDAYLASMSGQAGPPQPFNPVEALMRTRDPKMVEFLAQAPNMGLPEVARVLEQAGPDGRPQSMQFDKFGRPVGSAVQKPVEAKVMDLGGKKQAYDPYGLKPGQTFQTTMSDAERDTSARGWAGQRLAQEKFAFEKTQPPKMSAAQEKAALDAQNKDRQSEQMLTIMRDARNILKTGKTTASGVGAAVDAAGRMVGATNEGAQDAAKLEALSGWLVANVPRMEGPQSNYDVQNYMTMAGKIGDRTTPIAERLAALDQVESLQKKYRQINSGQPVTEQRTVKRTGMANGRKVVEYSDGSIEYAD